MTRLFTSGLETGTSEDFTSFNVGMSISSSVYRTGGYSLGVTNNGVATTKLWTTSSSTYYGQSAIYATSFTTAVKWFFLYDASNNNIVGFQVSTGRYVQALVNNSVVATGTIQVPASQWFMFEFYFNMADSGHITTKMNGVQDIDYSGDTKPGSATTVSYLRFDMQANLQTYFDDIVINDADGTSNNTWVGGVRLQPIRPNAAGDSTQFSRGGTDSGSNYGQVDEVPSTHTEYVYTTTVDNKDLYNCGTWTVPAGATIKNVIAVATALLDSGSGNLAVGLKSGSEEFSSDQALGITSSTYLHVAPTQPGGSAWDQTAIDGVQVGIKAR